MNHHPAPPAYDATPLESKYHVLTAIALNAAGTTLPARTIKDIASITSELLGTRITRRPSDRMLICYASSRLVTMTNKELCLTDHFPHAWPAFSQRTDIQAIDAVVRALLPLRHHNGLLSFLAHAVTPDGGIQRATAHLHRLLNLLHVHVRDTHYLGRTTSPERFLRRAHNIARQQRLTVELLRASDRHRHTLDALTGSAVIEQLRTNICVLPSDATTWTLLDWLTERIEAFCDAIGLAGTPRTPCIDNTPVTIALNNLLSVTGTEPPHNPSILEAHDSFASTARAWLRALTPTPDHDYYAAHRAHTDPRLAGKVHCACYDLEDSVNHLKTATHNENDAALDECRTILGAIPRNYAILFGGSLGHAQGDKDFAFHQHASQALHSTALALAAIDDIRKSKRFAFPVYARAAIGTGKLTVLDGQPQSLSVNQAFHAINQAADQQRDKTNDESQLLLIEPFLREHPHLKTYALERIDLDATRAWRLDWRRVLSVVVQSVLRASPADAHRPRLHQMATNAKARRHRPPTMK